MAEYIIQGETLTALADEIRVLSGTTDKLGTTKMIQDVGIANAYIADEAELIAQIQSALEGKAGGNEGEQAIPTISVNANGLITATAGTKSSTHQLAFQAAKTITPSITSQIAVSGGYYTGGNITVGAIPSQYVIPSGILNITTNGTHDVKNYASATVNVAEGSGEQVEWSANEDAIIEGAIGDSYFNNRITKIRSYLFQGNENITSVSFFKCTNIGSNAFYSCSRLTTVSFPACTTIGSSAFHFCSSLTTASFPACTTIGSNAFRYCSRLTTVSFPVCTSIGENAFGYCRSLTTASFPVCKTIGSYAFQYCESLTTVSFPVCATIDSYAFYKCYRVSSLTLGALTVCKLLGSNAFSSTPYTGYSYYFSGTPHIYVPASLVSAYQSATNWVYFSSYFSAIPGSENWEDEGEDNPGEGSLITFAIDGTEYQAEEGMIWSDWISSIYNTAGASEGMFSHVLLDAGGTVCYRAGLGVGDPISSSDEIIADYNYAIG